MLDHAVRIKSFNIHLSQFIVFMHNLRQGILFHEADHITPYKAPIPNKHLILHKTAHIRQCMPPCRALCHNPSWSNTPYYTHITHIIVHSYHSHFNALTTLTSYYANITHTIVHSHHSHHSYHIELISLTSYYTDITHTILHSHHSHHITLSNHITARHSLSITFTLITTRLSESAGARAQPPCKRPSLPLRGLAFLQKACPPC